LAWTLPQLLDALPETRAARRVVPYLYVVDAVRMVVPSTIFCPKPGPDGAPATPDFSCFGGDWAWLVDAAEPVPEFQPVHAPPNSLRLPNVTTATDPEERGFWLLNPLVNAEGESCFVCPPAGAADLVGQVIPLGELPAPSAAPAYPADRALNVLELDEVLGPDPGARAGIIVIADVTLEPVFGLCSGECPRYYAVLEDRRIHVYDPGGADPGLAGTLALRAREDGGLDLLGLVRAGPDGLAWSFPDALYELIPLRGPGIDPVPYLYLVDGWQAVSPFQPTCAPASGDPRFSCGDNEAWLVPDEATARNLSTGSVSTPAAGIRVPNGGAGGTTGAGFWLIDPWVDQSGCSGCTLAGAADLFGRVLTLDELGASD
jgi:hypothetical protein